MQELKALPIWFPWRKEIDGDHIKKLPFAAGGGATGTNEKYRHTWVTYDEAVEAAEKVGAAGVGFVIPEGYFFLDIDHAALDDPRVQTMLSRFDSYAEYSVSGNGLHIYGKVDLSKLPIARDKSGKPRLDKQFYMKNPNNGIELYIGGLTNRFAAFTGNIVADLPLKDCSTAVLTTLDKDMRKAEKVKYSASRDGDRAIFDIVCNLSKQKNGEKFKKLYYSGDYSDYGSHSEADLALCTIFAFRTGPDPELIDELFRSSALMRDKWEREDYRTATIDTAILSCNGTFHRSRMEHPYFIAFDENTGAPYIKASLLAKWTREHLRYLLVRDNGKQGLLIYVYQDGVYRLHAPDMLKGIIKGYIADYDEEMVKMNPVNEAFNQIITDTNYISQNELNADESIINFHNGLLSLKTNPPKLLPHSPEYFSTIQIPCDWKETPSPTPVFDGYLRTLVNGDSAVAQLLMEFIGVCVSNIKGWRMKKSLFLVGAGDTGKSQLKSLVERMLGSENFIGIDLKEIEARFGTGAIYGTRLAGSSDMSFMSVDELKTFKKITGGDSLFAEFKGQQGFQYTYGGLLWFCMNRLPKFGGDDGQWVYNRIMVVNCPNVIPRCKQDKQLLDKMFAERDGIVYKAVMALRTVIDNGYRFSEPESVENAQQDYRNSNSSVISFAEECLCPWPDGRINSHCRAGKIDHILFKSISRFARNTVTLLETVRELKALGISVYFEEQNIDTSTADGELMLSILASYAQEESLSTSENMKWRIRSNFQQGLAWNPTLLGYRYEQGTFVVQPEEAEIVRQIYDSYLDGMGATAIAKLLNESGKVSRFGNAWGQRSIMLILQNDSYTGNLLLQKTFSENHLTKKKKYNEGQLPMYHIQNSHEAIIPLEKYIAVQAEIKRRAEKYAKPHRNKGNYLFSGLLVCGICGKHYRRKETAAGPVWICPIYNSMGKAACPSKRIPESTLLEVTKKTLGSLEALTGKITAVRAEKENTLVFCFPDGTESVKRWYDRSRADSWTEEMKNAAAQKARERRRNHNG